jgi:succinate-semialdehyde dehydrogenase/glutarate-semialdehyde dehydrogenase
MEAAEIIEKRAEQRRMEVGKGGFSILNPATGEKVGEYPLMGPEEVSRAIDEARRAFPAWSQSSFATRARIFRRAASHLAERAEQYAEVICSETGKTQLDAMLAEVFPTCDLCHYYAKNSERFLRPVKVGGSMVLPGRRAYYTFEPRGVVGVIAPWNYPFTLASGPVISALAAGNAVVLKPSSQTTASAKILEEILREAGLPDEVLQVVTGSGSVTGRALIENPDVDMLFFTGSSEVGIEVNREAAENLVPAVMELGGKDSMIVSRNADLDRAAHAAAWGSFFNSGQTCTGVEFCFVERAVYTVFLNKVLDITGQIESGTLSGQVGSMTMESQVKIVEEQIEDAVAKGARVLCGGARRSNGGGLFFAPTVITEIRPGMKIWQEETFGPILPVVAFDKPEEAIEMANSTQYGLAGSVFSEDMEEARMYASRMETGSVNINDCLVTYALPSLPFGGVKASGVGYYHGEMGIRNFCRIKSVTEFKGLYTKEFFHYPVSSWIQEAMGALLVVLYSQSERARLKALPKTTRIAGDLIRGMWRKRKGLVS